MKIPTKEYFYGFQRGIGGKCGWAESVLQVWAESVLQVWAESVLQVWAESVLQVWAESVLQVWAESVLQVWAESVLQVWAETVLQVWAETVLQVWAETVLQVWAEQKQDMQEKLRSRTEGILVYLDSRYDLSRFAYHGTAPIMDVASGRVIEMVTKTRVACGNSWVTEEHAVQEGLSLLLQAGVKINEAVHDDKKTVDRILSQLGIISQKDIWHKSKKLGKCIFEIR